MMEDLFIVEGRRVPQGRFGGTYSGLESWQLGAGLLRRFGDLPSVDLELVDGVFLGHCRQAGHGPNPARTAAFLGGIGKDVYATTVNTACLSGLDAIRAGADFMASGRGDAVICGGMEVMSSMPHILKGMRFSGKRHGDLVLKDGWSDATDPLVGERAGVCAEERAEELEISREEMDGLAVESHRRALRVWTETIVTREILTGSLPVTSIGKDGEPSVVKLALPMRDETIRDEKELQGIGWLRPAFKEQGKLTAGNTCCHADGAAVFMLATKKCVEGQGLKPRARLGRFIFRGGEPSDMTMAPGRLLASMERCYDTYQVHESFSSQLLDNMRMSGIGYDRMNLHGGGLALGHPTGMSGARIVLSLLSVMEAQDMKSGLAVITSVGGMCQGLELFRTGF